MEVAALAALCIATGTLVGWRRRRRIQGGEKRALLLLTTGGLDDPEILAQLEGRRCKMEREATFTVGPFEVKADIEVTFTVRRRDT